MANISGIVKSARKIMRQDTGTGSDELRILQLGWMLFLKIFSDKDQELELLQDDYISPIPEELHWKAWASDDEGMTGDELLTFVDQTLFPTLANTDLSTGNKRALLVHEVFANNYNYMKSGIHLRQVINKLNEIDFNNSKDKQVFGQIYETFLSELQSAGTLGEFYTPRAITELLAELTDPKAGEKVLDPACGTGGYLTAALEHLKTKAKTVADREAIGHNVTGWEYKPLPYLLGNTNLILHDINTPNIQYGDSLAKPLTEYRQKDRVDVILANPPFGGVVSNNNENNFPQTYRTKESADLFLILMIHLLKDGGRAAIVLPDGSLTGDGVKERIRQKLLEDCNLHTIIRLPNSVFQPYASVATNLLFFTKGEPTQNVWYYQHKLPEGYKAYSKTKPIQLAEFDSLKKWWSNREENEHAWQVDIETIKANGFNLDVDNQNITAIEHKSTNEIFHVYNDSTEKIHLLIQEIISKTICSHKIVENILQSDISLFKNVEVVKQLRNEILAEAVQGKLTLKWRQENKPSSVEVNDMLRTIELEKNKLVQEKIIRKPKACKAISKNDIPFDLPESWQWCRLGNAGLISRGKGPRYDKTSDIKMINQKCVRWFYVDTQHCKTVDKEWFCSLTKENLTSPNEILVNSTGEGTIGRAAIVDGDAVGLPFDSHVLRYRAMVNSKYIVSLINSEYGQFQVNELKGAKSTKQTELGVGNLSNMLFPIPTMAEQNEIVKILNDLLGLCDQLEAQITTNQSHADSLMQAVLQEAFSQGSELTEQQVVANTQGGTSA